MWAEDDKDNTAECFSIESIIDELQALQAQWVLTQCVQFHLSSSQQCLDPTRHQIERFGCCGLFLYLWLTDRNDGPQSELIISHTEQLSIWKSALTIIYNISILYQSSEDIRCFVFTYLSSFFKKFLLQVENNFISLYVDIWGADVVFTNNVKIIAARLSLISSLVSHFEVSTVTMWPFT